jgi:hypothetical protein
MTIGPGGSFFRCFVGMPGPRIGQGLGGIAIDGMKWL